MPTKTTTFATNDVLTANDLNSLAGAWNSYTPQVDQGASTNIAKTVTYAKYLQFGKLVICRLSMSMTATGTSGSAITVTLPVTAATSGLIVGSALIQDTGTANYVGFAYLSATTKLSFYRGDISYTNAIGADPSFALASGDGIGAEFMYEAA